LSQPGQFLARERVTVAGPKGELCHVAVLGPERSEAQVEISMTDARVLGLQPPIRESGQVAESPGAVLRSETAQITIDSGVIVAQRHLHLTPEDAARFCVADRQVVRLQVYTQRPLIFQDVLVRVRPDFATRAHLDFDEANACGLQPGDVGRILS
jgi:propanediol utilization protein